MSGMKQKLLNKTVNQMYVEQSLFEQMKER